MAEMIFATLTANGNDIKESPDVTTVHTMAGEDVSECIEIVELSYGTVVPMESSTGVHARGARQQRPIEFTARLGKTGPLLQQALTRNEEIEGTFKMFRQNATTGETELMYTVAVRGARFAEVLTESPNSLNADTASLPVLVHCKLVAHTTTYTSADDTEFEDSWSERG